LKAKLAKEEAEKVATALENAQPEATATEEPAKENAQPEPTAAESPAKALTEARSSEKKEEEYVKHAECCIIS